MKSKTVSTFIADNLYIRLTDKAKKLRVTRSAFIRATLEQVLERRKAA